MYLFENKWDFVVCLGVRGVPPRGGNSHVRGGGGGGGRGFGRNSEQQSSHEQATHA